MIGIDIKNEKCVVFCLLRFSIKFMVMVIFECDVLGNIIVSICEKFNNSVLKKLIW